MMIRVRPKPGSAQFAARLLARLRTDLSGSDEIVIDSARASSRNTVIYRVRAGDTALICKAELGQRPKFLEDEYLMLQELQQRLAGSSVRSLSPVAVYPDLGVLVTREEQGETVRRHIDRGLDAVDGSPARRFAEDLMDGCAEALFRFHSVFGLERDAHGVEHACSYLDFHPGNLLVQGRASLVLMDPPPKEPPRPVHFDLGCFCFGIARAGFPPIALARLSQYWLDRLKADFVAAYFRRLGRPVTAADIARIRAVERHRAGRSLLRYGQFFRYRNWPLELVRLAYFAPIIGGYVALHLSKSYRRLARAQTMPVVLKPENAADR